MPTTLEQELRAAMSIDDTGCGPLGLAGRKVGEPMSDRELDLMAWGVYYGIAFGIARHEDVFAKHEDVARRAVTAAWPIFLEHSGPVASARRDD